MPSGGFLARLLRQGLGGVVRTTGRPTTRASRRDDNAPDAQGTTARPKRKGKEPYWP